MRADLGLLRQTQMPAEPGTAPRTVAQAMSRAATAWLADLDDEQRTLAWWGPPGSEHEGERRRWFYTPTNHGGLAFNAQFVWQQRRGMQLVASGLSAEGYDLVATIIGAENILDRVEGFNSQFDTPRGRDPSRYYLRVFGDPESQGPWGWRFGGHHVSLNFLVVDGQVRSTTPRFFGMDPAVTTLPGGVRLDPLSAFQSTARDLVTSLSPDVRTAAILLDRAPADIVLGNRPSFEEGATMMNLAQIFRRRPGDDELMARMRAGGNELDRQTGYGPPDHALLSLTSKPKGIPGTDLDSGQRDLLDTLMRTYHDGLPIGLTPQWDIDELHFAWAGSTEPGVPNYYRIQGGGFLIEWDNTARGGNHAHGVVRHLSNDFGGDVLAGHRNAWHNAEAPTHHSHQEEAQP